MRFAFASTLSGLPWGASEELWSQTARLLLRRGRPVTLLRPGPATDLPAPLEDLLRRGARRRRTLGGLGASLVLVSMSHFGDDPGAARLLRALRVPYALLVHCASSRDWITEPRLAVFRKVFAGARRVFFVSRENLEIAERQLARAIPRGIVVDNPLAVWPADPLPWPPGEGLHLACVGRLHCRSKGQDLVLEVLARPRWRRREVRVTFWGRDQGNRLQLQDLVQRLGLADRVRFAGHTPRPLEIWRRCHGLFLPSRYEGMPMVTPEAMTCGRVPVVTDCGRNGEWVEDGVTGFLAPAATPDLVDEALERAWQERARWPAIGRHAAERIYRSYDPRPVDTFADLLTTAAEEGARR